MSDRTPLEVGEHVDLDSGVRVERSEEPNEDLFLLRVADGPPTFLPRDELRVAAELAGFDVSDPADGDGDDGDDWPLVHTGDSQFDPTFGAAASAVKAVCPHCDRTEKFDDDMATARAWLFGHIRVEHHDELPPLSNAGDDGDDTPGTDKMGYQNAPSEMYPDSDPDGGDGA